MINYHASKLYNIYMSAIDRFSLEQFIHNPGIYYLENAGGVITAHLGRSDAHKDVHEAALAALNQLLQQDLTTQVATAEFKYKIDKWAEEPGQGPKENRAKAADAIKVAYATKQTVLSLGGLRLSSFFSEISHLVQLKSLNLGYNQLAQLPSDIGQLVALEYLYLINNFFTNLPREIGQLMELKELHIGNNLLCCLPPEIGQLVQLKHLSLNKNLLTNLFPEIGQLVNLETLDLSNNQLAELPSEIGQLAQLKELWLDNNHLSFLPPEIGQLAQLKELWLHNNHLSFLPPAIGQLTQLKWLNLTHNQLTNLAPEIGQLAQLQSLSLKRNLITNLAPEIGQLAQLQGLDLSHNHLTTLPQEIGQLAQLKLLSISDTPLTDNKTPIQIIASCPFLLKLTANCQTSNPFMRGDRPTTFINPQNLQEICQLNGLALEFIPEDRQTEDLVLTAITQNPASIAFARADFITYELAKRAVAIDPTIARFIPDAVIDMPTVLHKIEDEPYLLSLLFKIAPSVEQLEQTLGKDKAENLIKAAIGYDGRIISFIPADIQASDFGHDLIIQALEQTPLAYYGIDPVFFDAAMLRVLIEAHKDKKHNADLYSIVQKILVKIDVNDPLAHDHYFPIADELTFSYKDDPIIMAFLIAKYGKTLVDASDKLRHDYDFVFAAIHSHPDNIRESLVIDLGQQTLLEEYAKERRRQL